VQALSKSIKKHGITRGLSAYLAGLRAGGALVADQAWQRVAGTRDTEFARREARRFAQQLGKLKGTYVKIGQMMALVGEHLLPPALTEALHGLSDSTDPLPWRDIEPILQQQLGDRYVQLRVEPDAVAAASLAQVHRARIRASGETICLKIQYPQLAGLIDADFDAVVRTLLLARWVRAGRELDDWLEAMREHLHNEVDYFREAEMTQRMNALTKGLRIGSVRIETPGLYREFCNDRLLALEYIDGFAVNDPEVLGLPLKRRNALARAMLELFFIELFDWGLLQTDPNFGNYLIRLGDRRKKDAEDALVLLDFGSMMECSNDFLMHFRNTLRASLQRDEERLADGLEGLGCLPQRATPQAREMFAGFCIKLLEPLRRPAELPPERLNNQGEYCWAKSKLMQRAGRRAALTVGTRHFTPPSGDFALIARKLTGVFTFISVLGAEFNGNDIIERYVGRRSG